MRTSAKKMTLFRTDNGKLLRAPGACVMVALLVVCGSGANRALRAGEPKAKSPERRAILSKNTRFRTFFVFRTPVVVKADGSFAKAYIPRGKGKRTEIKHYQSPMPDSSWKDVSFADTEWARRRLPLEKNKGSLSGRRLGALHNATPNSIICARTRFVVDDPAGVGDLCLNIKYVGGVAVFLNGRELIRQHLPEGPLKPDTLAERYPDDLYILPGNRFQRLEKWAPKLFARRYRYIKNVSVPAHLLRKGTNVLAIEVHRAPVNEAATLSKRESFWGTYHVPGLWAYVALHDVELTAAAGAAVQPNAGRPKGVQVWSCGLGETVDLNSFGDPRAEPVPVRIDACRNGVFSGRLVISSNESIEDLKLNMSALTATGGNAKLPDHAVQLRCGRRAVKALSSRGEHLFDGLDEKLPERVKAASVSVRRGRRRISTYRGAVMPLWITVRLPRDARPGMYKGTLTVQAKGLEKTEVPVRCAVADWTLPDPVDFRVKHLPVFSPYSLAMHYEVPLWSEEHFKLIEKSFGMMAELNARRVDIDMVPTIRATWGPLEHCMFRLVPKQGGKGYEYDFSVIDRLFEVVEKTMKAPLPLQVNCWGWDRYRGSKGEWVIGWPNPNKHVAVLDPVSGKLSSIDNPKPGSEANYTFWKPVLDELRKRIERRGWWNATALGHQSYCYPPNSNQVGNAKRIWPDAAWTYSSHAGRLGQKWSGMPVLYTECVWTAGKHAHRGYRRLLKPDRERSIWNFSYRNGHRDSSPLTTMLGIPEDAILRGHDGLGYLCADFLPVKIKTRNKRNTRVLPSEVGNVLGASTAALLAGGPGGPLATGRYELFRLGTYRAEAVLWLQRGLDSKSISGDLAARVDAFLNTRSQVVLRGWDDYNGLWASDRELFALCAEVQTEARPQLSGLQFRKLR